MNRADLFHLLEILEDQCFLLNVVKLYNHESLHKEGSLTLSNDVFLHPLEIVKAKGSLVQELLTTAPDNQKMLSALVRGISICMALLTDVYESSTPLLEKCHTVDSFDRIIGRECQFMWTRSNCSLLLHRLATAFSFLQVYGTLTSLPAGTWSFHSCCHLCKMKQSRNLLDEKVTHQKEREGDFCPHLLRFKSVQEEQTDPYKNEVDSLDAENCLKEEGENLFPVLMSTLMSAPDVCNQTKVLGLRMQIARKCEQRDEAKKEVRMLYDSYLDVCRKKNELDALKCLNITCYSLMGQLVIYLSRRFLTLAKFSPLLVKCEQQTAFNMEQSALRLSDCLKTVSLQKVNNKIIQQEYEKLFVDPISLTVNSSKLLRHSIVAKEFMLIHGIEAKQLCGMSNMWNHLTMQFLMQSDKRTLEERFLYAVYALEVFNYWLSLIHVKDTFRLTLLRGDLESNKNGVVFLFDFEQMGLQLPNSRMFRSNYDKVITLCVRYLSYLHDNGLCMYSPSVSYILQGYK